VDEEDPLQPRKKSLRNKSAALNRRWILLSDAQLLLIDRTKWPGNASSL
jgi:hypothetical protein